MSKLRAYVSLVGLAASLIGACVARDGTLEGVQASRVASLATDARSLLDARWSGTDPRAWDRLGRLFDARVEALATLEDQGACPQCGVDEDVDWLLTLAAWRREHADRIEEILAHFQPVPWGPHAGCRKSTTRSATCRW